MLLALLIQRSRARALASRSFLARIANFPSYESTLMGARDIGAMTGEAKSWVRSKDFLGAIFFIPRLFGGVCCPKLIDFVRIFGIESKLTGGWF